MIGVVYVFRRKGVRPSCVRIRGCATRRDVLGIKYSMCFVCLFREEKLEILQRSCRLGGLPMCRLL